MPFGARAGLSSPLQPTALAAARAVGETEQPQVDNIYKRSERSLVASGKVAMPAGGAQVCIIPGFKDAKQFAVYMLDWSAWVSVADAVADLNLTLALGGVPYYTLPLPKVHGVAPVAGRLYIAPNGGDVEIDVIAADASATYGASLVMTRLVEGYQIG